MVVKVNSLTKKSFKNYTGPNSPEEFKKKNIVFGYNGRGKSSLAFGIIEEYLKDRSKTEEDIRFFDRHYLRDNLLLKIGEDSKLKGVIANFGKKDVESEKKIDELEKQIVNIEEISDKIKLLDDETREEINKVHDDKKGKTSIQKKPADKTIQEILDAYDVDVQSAKKIEESEEKLKSMKGDNSLEEEKSKIDTLNISEIANLNEDRTAEIKTIMTKKFNDIEIPTTKLLAG